MCTALLRGTDSMAPHIRIGKRVAAGRAEDGFTLAGVIVIMSVMMIFVAYTVPRQWSAVRQRDRELQTIFIMQQYAKAIDAYQVKNHIYPISIAQLADARQPRFLRCPKDGCIDPLTGEVDWFIIPQSQARAPGGGVTPPGVNPQGTQTSTAPPGVPMKDYAGGPFIGIRPNKSGNSRIILNGADHYEQWSYTALDYQAERNFRIQAAQKIWQ
jgi:type II secretory pathway pseudopilin PulG